MKKSRFLFVLLALMLVLTSTVAIFAAAEETETAAAPYEHVVVLGVDGMGNFITDTDTPNIDKIFEGGATTRKALVENPSASAQGWGSLLTGAKCTDHGMTNYTIQAAPYANDKYPTIFKLIREERPDADLVSFCCWNSINTGIVEDSAGVVETKVADANMGPAVSEYLAANGAPSLLFCQFNVSDSVGHASGYGGAEHLECLTATDSYIGDVYKAYEDAGLLDKTLFIVTSDHGGTLDVAADGTTTGTHGGWSDRQKYVFYGIAGKGVNNVTLEDIYIRDTAAIVAYALGVKGNEIWDSYVPAGVFADNMTPLGRPASAPELVYPSDTPSADSEKYIGNYIDLDELRAGFFFDSDLTNFVEGSDVELKRLVGDITEGSLGTVYYPTGLYGNGVRLSYEGYLATDDLKFDTGSFSIGMWIKPDVMTSDQPFWSTKIWSTVDGIGGSDQQGIIVRNYPKNDNTYLAYSIGSGAWEKDGVAQTPSHANYNNYDINKYEAGEWINALMVIDREANTLKYYINFELATTYNLAKLGWYSADYDFDPHDVLAIGQDVLGTYKRSMEGMVDDLLIWNKAIGADTVSGLASYYEDAIYDYNYKLADGASNSTAATDEVTVSSGTTNTDLVPFTKLESTALGAALTDTAKYQIGAGFTLSEYTDPKYYVVDFDIATESDYLPMNFVSIIAGDKGTAYLESAYNRITEDGVLVGSINGNAVTRTLSTSPYDWQHVTLVYDLVGGEDGYPLYIYLDGDLVSNAEWMKADPKANGEAPASISSTRLMIETYKTNAEHYATTLIANAVSALYTDDTYGNLGALLSSGASMLEANKIFDLTYGKDYALPTPDNMFTSGGVGYRTLADAIASGDGTVELLHNDYYTTHLVNAPCTVKTGGYAFSYKLGDAVVLGKTTDTEGGVFVFDSKTPLYTLTDPSGNVTEVFETKSFGQLLSMLDPALDGNTITLYEDVEVSENTTFASFKTRTVNIDLNGHTLSNANISDARIRTCAARINIYGGKIVDTAATDIFFANAGYTYLTITDCDIKAEKLGDFRTGEYTFKNCTIDSSLSRFASIGSSGDTSVTLTLDSCTVTHDTTGFISSTRTSASYPEAIDTYVVIKDTVINTGGALLSYKNTVDGCAESSHTVTVTGNTKIKCTKIEAGTNTVENTVINFGKGVMLSVMPAVSLGSIGFTDGGAAFAESGDATYPYTVIEEEKAEYLYTVTDADGVVTGYDEEMSLYDLIALATKTNGSTITLYADIDQSTASACYVKTKLTIDLNGHEITNTGDRIRIAGGDLILKNGTLNDTGTTTADGKYDDNDFIYIGASTTGSVLIDNCDIIANGYVIDIRSGNVTVRNSTYTQGDKKAGQFAYMGSSGSEASLVVEDCEIDVGGGYFVRVRRTSASYNTAVAVNISVKDTVIKTTGDLLDLANTVSADLSSTVISFSGETYLTYNTFDGATNTVSDTTASFGVGVKLSALPTLSVGNITFSGEATRFAETGDTEYPYVVSDGRVLYTVTESDGTVKSYYTELAFSELIELAGEGSTVTLYTDIAAHTSTTEFYVNKNISLNLNGFAITSSARMRPAKTLYIYGGTINDGSVDFVFFGTGNKTALFKVDSCTINVTGRLVDTRSGGVEITNSTIGGSISGLFLACSDGTGATISIDNCTVDLGLGSLFSISRKAEKTAAATPSFNLNNCTVTTTGYLFYLSNLGSPDTSTVRINITGDKTRLSFDKFDNGSCTVKDTVVTLGLGVQLNNIPTLATGSIELGEGAKGIALTEDASYPYLVSDKTSLSAKPYFSLTLYSDFTLNLCFCESEAHNIVKVTVGGVEITPFTSNGMVFYPIKDIAAYNAAEIKQIEVDYLMGDIELSTTLEYSVVDYAKGLLASTFSTESKEMISRAIDYVKISYEYAGEDVPASVTELLASDAYKAISSEENVTEIPESSTDVGGLGSVISSAQIDLGSSLKFRFNIKAGVSASLTVKTVTVNETYEIVDGKHGEDSFIEVKMRAFDMYSGVITLKTGEDVGTYDLKAYAHSDALALDETGILDELLLAMYNYCREANEYMKVQEKDFRSTASVVVKDGKEGTVTFVLDDGKTDTSDVMAELLPKYENLKATFAIIPKALATLHTEYNEETGKYEYVFDENGKYTYSLNDESVEYWRSILEAGEGRFEIISHTLTHSFWGLDDNGGIFTYANSDGKIITSAELPAGSVTAEIYAAAQILEDVFGIEASTVVLPGIGIGQSDVVIDGVTYKSPYHVFFETVAKAYADGTLIGMRGNGFAGVNVAPDRVITPEYLATVSNRIAVEALTVRNTNDVSLWLEYIDYARESGGWAPFCLHRIVPDTDTETSYLNIFLSQAEELFAYANAKNVWIANYTEATKYYTEWSTAEVTSVYDNGTVKVTLTDGENDELFDEALTVKVTVPTSWDVCIVNGATELTVMTDASGEAYVLVDIVPDSGAVTLTSK